MRRIIQGAAEMMAPPSERGSSATQVGTHPGGIWRGLALALIVACASFTLGKLPGLSAFSPMILAIIFGMLFHALVGTPAWARAGVALASRKVLRAAIVLLGLQLTIEQIAKVGAVGIGIITVTLVGTFLFTIWFGRMIGVERRLSELIAAGTSICGASAVVATNAVTGAADEDAAYAVACVTLFGSLAMFVYPLLPGMLNLDPQAYGFWAGASIHEVAQVVAASFQDSVQAGEFGTIAKLSRVMLLAPMLVAIGLIAVYQARKSNDAKTRIRPPIPWFVLGFMVLIGVNSAVAIPVEFNSAIVVTTSFLLTTALAAMGLEIDVAKLRDKGARPLILGMTAALFISVFSLILVKMMAPWV